MIPGFVKTTEWVMQKSETFQVRQHIWKGLATFQSGRQEWVFYYVSEIYGESKLAESRIHKFMDAPAKLGLLLNWKTGRRCRPVVSVEWMNINYEPR